MKKHWDTLKNMLHSLKWIVPSMLLLASGAQIHAHSKESVESMQLQQTTRTIDGVVKDTYGEPLIGVSVVVKGTTIGTLTDIDGRYSLKVEGSNTQLVFSYVGHKSQTVTADKTTINITLQEDAQMIGEVVVVGYGIQKKENLTGAVASVDIAKTMDSRPVSDVGRALQGAVPGLTVTTGSGELGEAPIIKIRGGNMSPNSQNGGKALVLLDNIEIDDITMVNPDDIESISVLKDASSSSIYGARGANGVILITSKSKNKNEKVRISYSNNFAWKTSTKKPTQLPGWQQAEINLIGVGNKSGAQDYNVVGNMKVNANVVEKMKEWESLYGGQKLDRDMVYGRDFEYDESGSYYYRTWDWYDMFIKEWTPQQSHNVTMSGGSEKTSYNASFGYLNQDGLTKINPDNFQKYNAALSLNTEISKMVSVRANVMFAQQRKSQPMIYNNLGPVYDYLYYLYRWQPMYPYGTFEGKEFRSAMTDLNQASTTKRNTDYWRMGTGITLKLMKGLTVDADFVYSTSETGYKEYGNELFGYNTFGTLKSIDDLRNSYGDYSAGAYKNVTETLVRRKNFATNAYATYSLTVNKDHAFKFMAGTNLEESEYRFLLAGRNNIFDASVPELSQGYGLQTVGSDHSTWAVAGFFGRTNYDYQGKYLLEVNGRYDGSSKFPQGDRFTFLLSGSAGYRITEEKFMQPLKPLLSDLKIRASYGEIGNQDVGSTAYLPTMKVDANYKWMTDGNYNASFGTAKIVSNSLTWEKSTTIDVGFDARFLDGKLGATFDWYRKYTTDILSKGADLPASLGGGAPLINFGEMVTPGWELALDFNHRFSNGLNIYLGAQISDYYTKITKWASDAANLPVYGEGGNGWYDDASKYREGMRLGDIWGYKVDRLFQESDFDAKGNLLPGIPDHSVVYSGNKIKPGYVKYHNLDDNEVINGGSETSDDSGDKTVLGNMFPRYEYGFTLGADYKGFDFKIFFQGIGKRHIWAAGNQVLPGFQVGEPFYEGAEDYWTTENTDAFYPAPFDYQQKMEQSYQISDRYLLNMRYLRAKTLTFGYTVPKSLVSKAMLEKVRVYFTAENLFEFDKVKPEIDPEVGIKVKSDPKGVSRQDVRNFGRSYPFQRTISFGLQVVF